jgi:hypothetical protein
MRENFNEIFAAVGGINSPATETMAGSLKIQSPPPFYFARH